MESIYCRHMIKSVRKMNGLSLRELSDKVGISKQALSKYETGKTKLDYDKVNRIAASLDVPISAFYTPTTEIVIRELIHVSKSLHT